MATKTKSDPAPIYTADNKPMEIGDVVYGLDTCCENNGYRQDEEPASSQLPKITRLVVSEFDLGVRRTVRLRKPDGTEWVWSAQSDRNVCQNKNHFLYSSLAEAKKRAVQVAEEFVAERVKKLDSRAADSLKHGNSQMKIAQEDAAESLEKAKQYKEALKNLKALKKEQLQ